MLEQSIQAGIIWLTDGMGKGMTATPQNMH